MNLAKFLHHLARSRLLPAIDLEACELWAAHHPDAPAQEFAEQLLRTGKLSRYQMRKLLKGHSSGFVLGAHEILAPLGKGGMGYVYLARDHEFQRLVALKLLTPRQRAAKPGLLIRLQRELKFGQRFSHPGIIKAYALGESGDVHWLAIEFVRGIDLYRVVRRHGPVPPAQVGRLMGHAALALDEVHRRGVVHTDLKPGNLLVLLDQSPRDPTPSAADLGTYPRLHSPKLIDFGLAIELEGTTDQDSHLKPDRIAGTFGYAAPEQTKPGLPVGPAADLFAFGCTLFYLLTGEIPFPGETNKEKIRKVRHEAPAWYLLPAGVPSSLRQLLQQLLEKKPAHRPRSAAAVADALFRLG